ncbi:ABC transporter permease [candidate division KSB1 bacterium]|nr:ABC transporter permease [candidate division KSB1 bacterium]
MLVFVGRRLLLMIPTLLLISIISFALIQLPPGDYLTSYVQQLSDRGEVVDQAIIDALRQRYGLDKPFYMQYLQWMWGVLHGDFGQSFEWNKPVKELIWERLGLTFAITLGTIIFTWIIAVPIGIYSAIRQYTIFDTIFTFLGFIGLSTPGFLLALLLMYYAYTTFGTSIGGLFSPDFIDTPWSLAKVWDLMKHIWIPIVVLGFSGTAGLIRVMRANLLDQLGMQYVITARAKGISELKLLFKYPVRIAINPLVSTIGWMLPQLVSGAVIVAMVLNLPTTGPIFLQALMNQDMYLAGSFVLMLSFLTILGTLISDILLAWVDPRIRFGRN